MKNLLKFQLIVLVILFATTNVIAQEWTKEQLELWQIVEDGWKHFQTGDIDGLAALTHEKYQGWNDQQPLPINKEMMIKFYKRSIDLGDKVDYFFLNPARIVITKNAAVVDYYFNFKGTIVKENENEEYSVNGQNVEFYVKEDGKWLLLGDMTTINYKED